MLENILPISELLLKGISKEYTTTAGYFNTVVMICLLVVFGVQQLAMRLINIVEKLIDAYLSARFPNARFSQYTPINPIFLLLAVGGLTITCLAIVGELG
ncbi:MAG: hypothetical protein VR69_07055 [Peptococcaceae bacterium BRH_c4b]|nr:MAG: hypothetical protein VR69_07055 [Peptococcaceae bacterium BRH_c4b]